MNRPNFVRAKDNPFTVQRVTSLPYRFQTGDWESNLTRLSRLGYRAAIVGPQGTGKSTLLRDLYEKLTQRNFPANYIFLPRDRKLHRQILRSAAPTTNRQITLVDGVERLSSLQRLKLYHRHPHIVVAVHSRPMSAFRLPTWIATTSHVETIEYVLNQIGMDDPQIVEIAIQLSETHGGNLRTVLRELYDSCAVS